MQVSPIALYQFELCPYCHKVKAGLELKGLPFEKIEVNPMNKRELPPLPEDAPKKVPVIRAAGQTVFDSTTILAHLDREFEGAMKFTPTDETLREKSETVEAWVNDDFCYALPTVIYGTWGEALRAAKVTAQTSNFGFMQNISVRAGGPMIMHQISKRILKKRNQQDGHAWVQAEVDKFEKWLGDADFIGGESLCTGDVAAHGAFTCVKDFPIFEKLMKRPKVAAWYARIEKLRRMNAS